jgi:hypothetical protein
VFCALVHLGQNVIRERRLDLGLSQHVSQGSPCFDKKHLLFRRPYGLFRSIRTRAK